jgi:hypothetical protein
MTERRWLTADWDDLLAMSEFAGTEVSARKVRLCVVGMCRLIWKLIPRGPCKEAVEVAEAFADRQATKKALTAARIAVRKVAQDEENYWKLQAIAACLDAVDANVVYMAHGGAIDVASAALHRETDEWDYDTTRVAALALLRDVVGPLPFRKVAMKPKWLTSTVTALASQMYESRDFSAMPILADALQDADCDNDRILDHCRGPGPHCRGCWVVDLILGKE